MSLQEKITFDMREAMRNGESDKRLLLSVAVGEFSRIDKNLTDEQVIKVLKKMRENAIEVKNASKSSDVDYEISILETYLPKEMSEEEIKTIIVNLIKEKSYTQKDIGNIMKESKELLKDSFNGKIVNEIIKKNL